MESEWENGSPIRNNVPFAFATEKQSNTGYMAKRKKDRLGSFKRMLRNQQLLVRILIKNPELNRELIALGTLPAVEEVRKQIEPHRKDMTLPWCFDRYTSMMNIGLMLAHAIDKETRSKIVTFINRFLAEVELGQEWFSPLLTYITAGIICPPYYNFHIQKEDKRVTLTLNPDTSIDDLRNEWPMIDEAIHDAWPDFKKTNLSPKFNEEIQEYLKTIRSKQNISDDFKYKDLSEFETILAKRSDDPKKAVADYRGKRLATEGVARKSVRIHTRKTDRDIVKELYGVKTKRMQTRKVNALRQRKHRLEA